jgi:uncharacterized protein YfdQ (DUF2303 family)
MENETPKNQENGNDVNRLLVAGFPSSEQPVAVTKVTVEYTQDADSNSNEIQFLKVSTEDAGGGIYYVIKTERWAFDNIDDLIKVLNDFEKRLSACR